MSPPPPPVRSLVSDEPVLIVRSCSSAMAFPDHRIEYTQESRQGPLFTLTLMPSGAS